MYSHWLSWDLRLRSSCSFRLLKGFLELTSSYLFAINKILQSLGDGRETFLNLLEITIQGFFSHFCEMVDDIGQSFGVLLLKDNSGIAVEHLSLSIHFMKVETVRVRTGVASDKVRAVFRCSKGYLQRTIGKLIAIKSLF